MKRFDPRIVIGLLLLAGGGLLLAQKMGYLNNATNIFWAGIFLAAGFSFLFLLFNGHWWASFPAFTLIALGALIVLPASMENFGGAIFLGGVALSFWWVYFSSRVERWWALIPAGVLSALALTTIIAEKYEDLGGAIFLGGIGLAFFIVYLTDRVERWWALIPGGVLSTLAAMTIIADRFGEYQTAGFFFLGLALTFFLVAVLAGMRWAYWPALALGIMAALGLMSLLDIANYVYGFAFMAAGVFLLYRYFSNR